MSDSSGEENEEELMPEEVFQGISVNSRDIFSSEEVADFVREWSEKDGFVEDLEDIVDSRRESVPPEKVFEHLVESNPGYSIDQILGLVDELGDGEWSKAPDVRKTGDIDVRLEKKLSVPGLESYLPLSHGYIGESDFSDSGKDFWLQSHEEGWFQTGMRPLELEEIRDMVHAVERVTPAPYLHEANFDGTVYFIDSHEFEYFVEFEDSLDGFEGPLYRFESCFGEVFLEFAKLPDVEKYRATIYSGDGETYPLEAYREVVSDQAVEGLKTRLELDSWSAGRREFE